MRLFKPIVAVLLALQACNVLDNTDTEKNGYEQAVQEFEAIDKKNPPEEGAVLFIGSSSIANWEGLDTLLPGERILNRGISNSEFSDLLYYAERLIYPYKPSKIFIYEGDNDLAYGEELEDVLNEAKELRNKIAKELPGVPVIFISAKPSLARWKHKEKFEEFNRRLREYAEETSQTLFADVWYPMLNENEMVYEHVFMEDNLHMSTEGYKIWESVLTPYLHMERNTGPDQPQEMEAGIKGSALLPPAEQRTRLK